VGNEKNSAEALPKTLPGVVLEQWIRCGRRNCRCAGGKKHGPYYYRVWRQDGRLRKAYVPRDEVEAVRIQCRARQEEEREERCFEREAMDYLRRVRLYLREVERHGRADAV
jgi:hypothetical protein